MRNGFAPTLIAGIVFTASAAFGQATPTTHAAAGPTFDVASVRPAAPIDRAVMLATLRSGKRPETLRIEGSRATFTYMSLKQLIAYAYKVRVYQVTGPQWIVTDRFDIASKLPEGASHDDVPAMLQALLVDRFKLAAHLETSQHPVLGLMVGKSGPKLKESTSEAVPVDENTPLKPGETKVDSIDGPMHLLRNPDGSTTYNLGIRGSFTLKIDGETGTMHLTGHGMSMKGLANMLTSLAGGDSSPVADMTGLTGHYDVAVDFSLADLTASLRDQGIDIPTRQDAGSSDPTGDSTISDALRKLGLKLEKSKAMVEQLVIDHVEKSATEN